MTVLPFVRAVAGLAAGILLYTWLPDQYWLPVLLAVAGSGVVGWLLVRKSFRQAGVALGVALTGLLMAMGWGVTWLHTARNDANNLTHLTDTLRAYEGIVTAQPEERAKTYRVELAVQQGQWGTNVDWKPLSGRVIVYLDKAAGSVPRYGDVWLVNGAPRLIDPPFNPGEFDYKTYLSRRNIYHQQYLRPYQRRVIGNDPPNALTDIAIRVNRWADSVLTRQIGTRAEYGIVNAMILGVRDDLDSEQYRAYATAGAVHILSVSGLHVGILFFVLTWLIGLTAGKRDDRVWLIVLQLAVLWFYALITGFSLPVLRSAAMFSMLLLAKALQRRAPTGHSLSVALFFILLYDPYALLSAGLQLSSLAVLGIGAWQSPLYQSLTFRYRLANKLWQITAVALVAQLVTFPLGVYYFHQFPTYFLLANPVVMVLSMVLLPLAMATLAFGWVPYLNVCLGWLLQKTAWLLNEAVSRTGQLPGAAWGNLWLSPVELILIYALILLGGVLLLSRNRNWLWPLSATALVLVVLMVLGDTDRMQQRRLAVHFLPHRTAVSFTTGNRSLLLTDLDTTDQRSYEFYLKNTFGSWGIPEPKRVDIRQVSMGEVAKTATTTYYSRDYSLLVWQGRSILLVNRLSNYHHWRLPAVVDYLIIRRNALRDWDQLANRVVARHIIFDDSSRTPLTDQLLADAKMRHIACHSVRQMGAYVDEF
ncbi:ComEC/Rec2 family competence protein [Spirosoma rhododendri]|uniref:ComEC family competence protein n=1 Tax=Spirosoma rhododendri TaxID=2728024 RepID=A0A7L5DMW3_9BACT|nr:ComEC/Rec2 family competence protein [Spirosoma rhododendri]QJD79789.1 ComEC family competence protein [Spirosoma rhododendri]